MISPYLPTSQYYFNYSFDTSNWWRRNRWWVISVVVAIILGLGLGLGLGLQKKSSSALKLHPQLQGPGPFSISVVNTALISLQPSAPNSRDKQVIDAVIQAEDQDGDGKISKQELAQLLTYASWMVSLTGHGQDMEMDDSSFDSLKPFPETLSVSMLTNIDTAVSSVLDAGELASDIANTRMVFTKVFNAKGTNGQMTKDQYISAMQLIQDAAAGNQAAKDEMRNILATGSSTA